MLKQFLFFFCLALVVLGSYKLYVKLAPTESRVEWVVESVAEAFNTMRKDDLLALFAHEYKDTSQSTHYDDYTIDKKRLENVLTFIYQERLDQDSGAFLYKLDPVSGTMSVTPKSNTEALAQFRIELLLKMGHRWTAIWGASVKASFRKGRHGWVIVATAHRTVMGAQPWVWED